MMEVPSTPERDKAKVTYAGRSKKKRESARNPKEGSPDRESAGEEGKGQDASMPPPPSPNNKQSKRDITHKPNSSRPSENILSQKPASHSARKSVSSLSDLKGSPSPMKPPSSIGRPSRLPSTGRFQTPDVDHDDTASITGSVTGSSSRALRRTEDERRQFFESQPECREVEPHRAFCLGCNDWVALNANRTYSMRPWSLHQKECKKKTGQTKPPSVSNVSKSPEKEDEAQSDEDDGTSSITQSVSDHSKRKTEVERQTILETDPRTEEVRPYEVLCKTCQKWIKLGTKQRYALGNWRGHQKRCSGSLPSSRIATAERKLKLVNDSAAKRFTVKSVECRGCDVTVQLEGEEDYNLIKWEAHKASCTSTMNEPSAHSPAANSVSFPEDSPRRSEKAAERPPPSVASTEATAVASDAAASTQLGRKRAREEDEGATNDDERPRTRPRTDSYKPSKAMTWLLAPFKSFIQGFKEGVQSSSSTSA